MVTLMAGKQLKFYVPVPKPIQIAIRSIQNLKVRGIISYDYLLWVLEDCPRREEVYSRLDQHQLNEILYEVPRPKWGTICLSCGYKLSYGAKVLNQCTTCADGWPVTRDIIGLLSCTSGFPVEELHRFILDMEFYND